ncbi:hypothetical protein RHM58_25105 [Pseudomonas sp. 10S4]|uniref:hypothetical protein n=1 Tax=Pseudomonas sp. 10S4 TaxID=3048583 RepID=UPI002AC8CF59|nr:hypothetical protein [Pseudomonas sp. 10S4]WPX17169.1 hypothetical protein RHM58_25105 [Pseudomonas sp. 10S4]
MDDFSPLSNGQWAVSVSSPEGCIFANLPSEFTDFFNRYRSHLGLPVASIANEHAALFSYKGWDDQPDSSTIYDWGVRLPQVCTLGVSAPKLLNWLSNAYKNIQGHQDLVNYARNKSQKDKLHFERAYRTIKQFVALHEAKKIEKTSPYLSCSPVPFFKFPLLSEKIKWRVDFDSIFDVLQWHIKSDAHDEYISVILSYIKFSSTMEFGASHLRSIAYEKFILWSLLVKKIPPREMSECDATEFYFFCASPPASWISNKPVRRFVKALNSSMLDPNPEWKPFLSS